MIGRALVVASSSAVTPHLEEAGLRVDRARDTAEALAILPALAPHVVVVEVGDEADSGLALVEALHRAYPSLPVIVLTEEGSEELATAALARGAASYVPAAQVARDLAETVERVLEVTREQQDEQSAFRFLERTEYRFVLDHNPERVRALIGFLRRQMARRSLGDKTDLMQVAVALDEAISNAIHHGNLEVSSRLREEDLDAYFAQIRERRERQPYRGRRTYVTAVMGPADATFVVRDEGRGFDPGAVPDPTHPENLRKPSGRGLLLIRTIMDEVRHNERGNEITMVLRRRA